MPVFLAQVVIVVVHSSGAIRCTSKESPEEVTPPSESSEEVTPSSSQTEDAPSQLALVGHTEAAPLIIDELNEEVIGPDLPKGIELSKISIR